MPSLFKSVVRSRRKKKTRKSSTSVESPSLLLNPSDLSGISSYSSNYDHSSNISSKTHPQHRIGSADGGEDDVKSYSSHKQTFMNRNSTIYKTPSKDSQKSKRRLLKPLQRKTKDDSLIHDFDHNVFHITTRTPDTTIASECSTPPRYTDDPIEGRRERSPPQPIRLNFDDEKCSAYMSRSKKSNNHIRLCREDSSSLPQTTKTQSEIQSSTRNQSSEQRGMKGTQHVGGRTSNVVKKQSHTKTVIMNGDIVVSESFNRQPVNDTVTLTPSVPSISKARAIQRESERNARAATVLDEKGNELFEMGHFDKAMACYTKALKLKRRTFAHLVEETDDLEESLTIEGEEDCKKPENSQALVSMATSINNIGYLRQRSGDATPEETMAAYKKSLKIKRRILGNDSLSVGKTLNNIGSVHYLKREFDLALPAYKEALEIMKANLGGDHPDVATVMSNIGDVYLAQQQKDASLSYYRSALSIRWEAFGAKSPRVVRLLEKISNLEIGDNMKLSGAIVNTKNPQWGDDVASELMVGSGYHPITEEFRQLHEQMKEDIEDIEKRERKAAVDLLKDKIIVIRGMRDIGFGNDRRGPELMDNDSVVSTLTARSRMSNLENRL